MSHAPRAGMPARRLLLLASILVMSGCAAETWSDDAADSESGEGALTEGWTRLGLGVAYKSSGGGNGVYIGYAGYSVKDTWSCAWTDELDRVRLKNLGIGHLY